MSEVTERKITIEITPAMVEAAKKKPNGELHLISGNFETGEKVPDEAIFATWQVDANGVIIEDSLTPNPNFKAQKN